MWQVHALHKIKGYFRRIWEKKISPFKVSKGSKQWCGLDTWAKARFYFVEDLYKIWMFSSESRKQCGQQRSGTVLFEDRTENCLRRFLIYQLAQKPTQLGCTWGECWIDTGLCNAQSIQTHACGFTTGTGISSCPQRPLSWNWPESLFHEVCTSWGQTSKRGKQSAVLPSHDACEPQQPAW